MFKGAPAFGLGVGGVDSHQRPDGDEHQEGGPIPGEDLDACQRVGDVALPGLVPVPLRPGILTSGPAPLSKGEANRIHFLGRAISGIQDARFQLRVKPP